MRSDHMKSIPPEKLRGIGLIEMCFFVATFGLMTASAGPIYHVYQENKHAHVTNNTISQAQKALESFYARNGRLPCPAPRNAPVDGANASGGKFGVEAACSTLGGAIEGTADVDGRTISGGPWKVRIGALPVRTLGLPDSMATDAWGHLLTYAVTEGYAVAPAPLDMLHGAITVVDSNGNNSTTLPGIAVYTVVAAGSDGRGAYGLNGQLVEPCPAAGTAAENCNDTDATFVATTLKSDNGANSFTSTLALRADTCTETAPTGTVGDVSFLLDSSGSMVGKSGTDVDTGKKDKFGKPIMETRLQAAKDALTTVIPMLGKAKAKNDPTNLIGLASFATYCEGLSEPELTLCKAAPGSCAGLTGTAASQCMFSAFDTDTVDKIMKNPKTDDGSTPVADVSTSTKSAAEVYDEATGKLTQQVTDMSASGHTPLYDTIMDMADTLGSGTSTKPNVLVVVSDGASNGDKAKNTDMIDALASKYPNLKLEFVFVGKDQSTCKKPDCPDDVQQAVFAKTKSGNQLKGDFIQVQNSSSILNALSTAITPCPQP